MTSHTLALKRELHDLATQMRGKLNTGTPEALAQWKELDKRADKLTEQILNSEQDAVERSSANSNQNQNRPPIGDENRRAMTASDEARSTPEYRKAFERLIRTGKEDYETRALSSTGDGQTLIPIGFEQNLEVKLKAYSGMRQACRILKTDSGNPLTWPTVDDTGTVGAIVAESAGVTTADPVFSSVTLGSSLISSKQVIVPIQVLQDQAVNLEQYLAEAFATRIGRAMELNYTTGSGSITGLITALVAAGTGRVSALGANSNSGNAGDTSLTSVGTADLGNLVAALDPAYRADPSCGFMAHSSVWDKLRRQLDKYGRPIWQTSVADGEPNKVWGFPFYVNQSMAPIGAGNISMLFGAFNKYLIRDSLGVTIAVQRELYATNHQIGFLGFARTDGKLLQPAAFTYLQHPLS
jgi:HK97 family phage major capsid protein